MTSREELKRLIRLMDGKEVPGFRVYDYIKPGDRDATAKALRELLALTYDRYEIVKERESMASPSAGYPSREPQP